MLYKVEHKPILQKDDTCHFSQELFNSAFSNIFLGNILNKEHDQKLAFTCLSFFNTGTKYEKLHKCVKYYTLQKPNAIMIHWWKRISNNCYVLCFLLYVKCLVSRDQVKHNFSESDIHSIYYSKAHEHKRTRSCKIQKGKQMFP